MVGLDTRSATNLGGIGGVSGAGSSNASMEDSRNVVKGR